MLKDIFVPKVIYQRRKERKTGIVKEKKDLLDLLMDMYDEETGTRMDDEELRAQVGLISIISEFWPMSPSAELSCTCIYQVSIKLNDY